MNTDQLNGMFKKIIEPYIQDFPDISVYMVCFMKYIPALHDENLLNYGSGATVNFTKKTLVFNEDYFAKHPEETELTMRHEIAHIITYEQIGMHKHSNPLFKHYLKQLRGSEYLSASVIQRRPYKYQYYCPKCKRLVGRKYKQKPHTPLTHTRIHSLCKMPIILIDLNKEAMLYAKIQ